MANSTKCFPASTNKVFEIVGYVLLVLGIILLFFCIPGWAWLAVLGLALMIAGYFLLRLSNTWR